MDALLLAIIRAAHGVTAAVWLGVSLAGVLSPTWLSAARASGRLSLRALAQFSMWALLVTGALLTLQRLADPAVSPLYVGLLAFKLALVGAMGLVALAAPTPLANVGGSAAAPRPGRWRLALAAPWRERLLLGLGLAAYVLGSLLTSAYEAVLRGP
ncbi:MAG: hypothetical protein IRZ14_15985 [Chloroflexi bacterium]|nr:hypothetical protein [Chloroflexota bacterium]